MTNGPDFSVVRGKLARPRGETSNSLLDVLADWNAYLGQHATIGQRSRLPAPGTMPNTPKAGVGIEKC